MFSILIALAVAASPTPSPKFDLGRDAPTVCRLRFNDQQRITAAGLDATSNIVDRYATLAKLNPAEKTLLTSYCNMFDVGAAHAIGLLVEQQNANRPAPITNGEPYTASFAR